VTNLILSYLQSALQEQGAKKKNTRLNCFGTLFIITGSNQDYLSKKIKFRGKEMTVRQYLELSIAAAKRQGAAGVAARLEKCLKKGEMGVMYQGHNRSLGIPAVGKSGKRYYIVLNMLSGALLQEFKKKGYKEVKSGAAQAGDIVLFPGKNENKGDPRYYVHGVLVIYRGPDGTVVTIGKISSTGPFAVSTVVNDTNTFSGGGKTPVVLHPSK